MVRYFLFCFIVFCSTTIYSQDLQDFFFGNDSIESQKLSADTLNQQIQFLYKQHEHKLLISNLFRGIELESSLENFQRVANYRILLAKVYLSFGWNKKALSNAEYAQVMYRQLNQNTNQAKAHHLLTLIHYSQSDIANAHFYLDQCEVDKLDKNDPTLLNEHLLLHCMLDTVDNLKTIQSKLSRVISISKSSNATEQLIFAYQILGQQLYKHSQYGNAKVALEKSLSLANELCDLDQQAKINLQLAQVEKQATNFASSNFFYEQYINFKDSLNSISLDEELNKIILKFENKEVRDERIDQAKNMRLFELKSRRSNFTLYSLLFSIGTILVAAFFIIQFYQQKLSTNEIIHNQNEQINRQKINELEQSIQLENLKSMIVGQESERDRIAKDLHDSLGGLLSTIRLKFDHLSQLPKEKQNQEQEKIHELVDVACAEVRNIAHNLRPGALDNLGLIDALKDMLNRIKSEDGPEIIFQYYNMEQFVAPHPNFNLHIYRIIQEMVNNSIKHAKAKEILIQLSYKNGDMELIVEDDGIGYDAELIKRGMGLDNIMSRVGFLKGEIHIDSKPLKGTSSLVHIPLIQEEA